MTLEEAKEKYPVHETIVGYYDCVGIFTCDKIEDLKDMNTWSVPPFTEPQEGYFNFVRYMGDHQFEEWTYTYFRVQGYLTLDGENYIPMTYDEDFGWEEVTDDEEHCTFAPNRVIEVPDIEMIAASFDSRSYNDGYIFTNEEELRKFVEIGKF